MINKVNRNLYFKINIRLSRTLYSRNKQNHEIYINTDIS